MLYFSYGFPDRGMPKQFVTKLYGIAELMGRESIKLVFFHLAYSTYIIGDRQTCITGNVVAPGGTIQFQDYLPAIEDDAILKFLVLIIRINHNYIT